MEGLFYKTYMFRFVYALFLFIISFMFFFLLPTTAVYRVCIKNADFTGYKSLICKFKLFAMIMTRSKLTTSKPLPFAASGGFQTHCFQLRSIFFPGGPSGPAGPSGPGGPWAPGLPGGPVLPGGPGLP